MSPAGDLFVGHVHATHAEPLSWSWGVGSAKGASHGDISHGLRGRQPLFKALGQVPQRPAQPEIRLGRRQRQDNESRL